MGAGNTHIHSSYPAVVAVPVRAHDVVDPLEAIHERTTVVVSLKLRPEVSPHIIRHPQDQPPIDWGPLWSQFGEPFAPSPNAS